MKNLSPVKLIILAGLILPITTLMSADTNTTYLKVLQASNDIQGVIQFLPDVEKLWPQDPEAYLKSASQAVHVLDGALNNSNANQAYVNLFTSMMQKPCPTNEAQAASWVELKHHAVYSCMRMDLLRYDKSEWLAVATFLGETRSKRIPNYVNQQINYSGIATTPAENSELQKALVDNERKKITDNFQSQLMQADASLMFLIQYACPFTDSSKPVDTNFINQVASVAHLTAEEKKQLQRE